eukprot:2377-Pelagococcus_subviridis.AAC.1
MICEEAFYGDGKSGHALRTLGFKVISFIVSNPPFSKLPRILKRLAYLKPFIRVLVAVRNIIKRRPRPQRHQVRRGPDHR